MTSTNFSPKLSPSSSPPTGSPPMPPGRGWNPKLNLGDTPSLQQFILENPLGYLITALPGQAHPIQVTPIPFILDQIENAEKGQEAMPLGRLRSHMARRNPHAQALLHSLHPLQTNEDSSKPHAEKITGEANNDQDPGVQAQSLEIARHANTTTATPSVPPTRHSLKDDRVRVAIIFPSHIQSYVSPSFYTHRKPLDGRVVPTWDFSAVEVHGLLSMSSSLAFLKQQTKDLTNHCEGSLMESPEEERWKVDDAPQAFMELLARRIVGVEIEITGIEGKAKLGQEVMLGDQVGMVRAFGGMEMEGGRAVAGQIRACMKKTAAMPDLENPRVKQTREVLCSDVGFVQEKKIKGPFGWYYTERKPWFWETLKRENWVEMVVVLAAVMIVGYALGSFLGWVYYRVWKY